MRKKSILAKIPAFMVSSSAALLLLAGHTMAADDLVERMLRAAEQAQQEHIEKMKKATQGQSEQQPASQPRRRQAPSPQASPQQSQQPTSEPQAAPAQTPASSAIGQAAAPGDCCTPEATAAIAKNIGKYDVLGIKLGMPAKEAAAILKTRGFQFKPETIKYDVLPDPLTYGVYAINEVLVRKSGVQPGAEKLYVTLTMPPNPQVVSKVNRFIMFTKETAPAQQALIGDLVKKYGPVSFATPPASLSAPGVQDLYWVDDAQGNRLEDQANHEGNENELLNICRGKSTFSSAQGSGEYSNTPGGGHEIQAQPREVKSGLEQGYAALFGTWVELCGTHNIIHARLYAAGSLGISAPGVVGALTVVIGNGPLHRSATETSHKYLMEAAKMREMKEKEGAKKNRPAL
jgi:hypothetical protein